MPRKAKAVQAELLPPEDQPTRGRKKLVDAEHTIKYSAPVPVTVEETEEDAEGEEFELIGEETEKARRRKKTAKDEREELRREMDKLGVASVSRLKLSIDKYRHSDSDDSGTLAEKDFCTKYGVTKDHIISDDYLDTARRYGAGRYWFTLRMDNKIVRQWERAINATVVPSGPVIPNVNPADPNSPHVIFQMPEGSQQPMPIVDPFKEAERALNLVEKYNKAFGRLQPETNPNAMRSEDEILAGALLKQPEMVENVVGSLVKRFGRGGGAGDDDPSPWAVAMKLVETGQAAQIVKSFIDSFFSGISGMMPRGPQNGQTQMASAPTQMDHSSMRPQADSGMVQGQSPQSPHQERPSDVSTTEVRQVDGQSQQMSPADQALMNVMHDCARRIPPQVTLTNLMTFADAINQDAPAYSIDGWITFFATMPIDDALEFVKTLPNGESIVALPHTKQWTEDLQKLIKADMEQGDDEE